MKKIFSFVENNHAAAAPRCGDPVAAIMRMEPVMLPPLCRVNEAIECIRKANEINDRPVLIDFHVWKDAMVWPMIAAGDANDNVTYMPGIKPLLNPQGNVSLQDEPDTTEENN